MVLSGYRSISAPTTSWASDATVNTLNSTRLSSHGLAASSSMRAFSISPLELVVKLKTIEPDTAAQVMMKKTLAITLGGRSSILDLRLAGASRSCGTTTTNSAAATRETTPGTMYAICQP